MDTGADESDRCELPRLVFSWLPVEEDTPRPG